MSTTIRVETIGWTGAEGEGGSMILFYICAAACGVYLIAVAVRDVHEREVGGWRGLALLFACIAKAFLGFSTAIGAMLQLAAHLRWVP